MSGKGTRPPRMERRAAMWAWHERGYSLRWIAARFGCTVEEANREISLEARSLGRGLSAMRGNGRP